MQSEFTFGRPRFPAAQESIQVGAKSVLLWVVPNRRARRYVLRLRPDGAARVTVPRGGSAVEARRFARANVSWLEKQLLRHARRSEEPACWKLGAQILFRGHFVQLERGADEAGETVVFGGESLRVADLETDLRPAIEIYLRHLAQQELPPVVLELAARHQLAVQRIVVRNQRSRWGSCSKRGTISLNWRLVQTPLFVRDYIVLHELAHLTEMNHSRRFWDRVAKLCPQFSEAERWLKQHSRLLRGTA